MQVHLFIYADFFYICKPVAAAGLSPEGLREQVAALLARGD